MENQAPPYPIQSVDYALQLLLILKRDGVRLFTSIQELKERGAPLKMAPFTGSAQE